MDDGMKTSLGKRSLARSIFMRKLLSLAVSLWISGFIIPGAVSAQIPEKYGDWNAFNQNRSILGLAAGETPMEKVFSALGNAVLSEPKDKHDLSSACFNNPEGTLFLVFSTGYLHDLRTLYAFSISSQKPEALSCTSSGQVKISIKTPGGIGLQCTKECVLEKLGPPWSEKENELNWEYQTYEKFSKPKITYMEAGPTDARYRLKQTSVGTYRYGTITVRFQKNRLVKIVVSTGVDADFSLQQVSPD
jgi:hypothetical protein